MHRHPSLWTFPAVAGLALTLACAGGCASYNKKADAFIKPYEAGQYDLAAAAVDDYVGPLTIDPKTQQRPPLRVDKRDAVIFRLEQGAILRAAGRLEESDSAFAEALDFMDQYDQQPEVRVTAEVGAAVTNLTFTDYHGYSYDRLGLELYRSLNFMQMGRLDDARTALRALQNRQIEAEDHFRKKIDALEIKNEPAATAVDPAPDAAAEPSEQTKQSIDVARTLNESGVDKKGKARPSVAQALAAEYGDDVVLVPDRSAYKAYSNPFGEYLQGIYFMAAGLNGSDTETASTAFKRVAGMLPDNPYVAQDLALAETVAAGSPVPPITYVFFETGQAPVRDSIRIDIPVFIVNVAYKDTGVDYVGAAFPKLKFVGGQTEYLFVNAGDITHQTQVFTDMDQVVRTDFNNELPIVITKTIIATAAKAAIAYGINKGTEKDPYANIAARVLTGIYQVGMNQADLRTWVTLPKQYQAARFTTPSDRQITLSLPNGQTLTPIQLIDGLINIVCVKSVQSGQTPVVQQFKFGEMARVPDPLNIRTVPDPIDIRGSAATELPADK